MKQEFKIIADLVEKNTRVLDVGCGDGTLMEFLNTNKKVDIRGIEISKNKVQKCIEKGLTVIWPADWTFTHRGIKAKKEHKYIITGWINFI